ncbi:MAG: hypothetical protein WBA73_21400 [Devosia sp.]
MHLARSLLLAATLALVAPLAQAQDFSADLTQLPESVQATRAAMLAAAKAGDLTALQAIIDGQSGPIQLGFGGAETAAEFATSNSVTGDGLDTLAELVDILEQPYEAVDDGQGGKFYIWPYLASADLEKLTDADKVAAYQLIDPDSLPDFIDYGGWLAMRTIINADGEWSAWVLGD